MSRNPSLARNTASNFVVQGWSMLLAFATTPYIVHGFGTDAYGVFAALSVFLGYMSFLDLGFSWGLIKFVADYDAHNDRQGIGEAAATTLAVFAAIGAGFTTAVFWFAPWLVHHGLNIPAELQSSGITALRVSGATFAVNLIGSVYGGVLRGLQRFELANGIQAVTGTVQTVTTIAAIAGGYGLVGVCSASLGVSLASVITLYILVRRSGVFAMGARPKLAMLRVLGSFSAYATLSRLGAQTLYQVEKVFIGLWLPISALGYYMVPFNLVFKVTGVASSFGSAFFPALSALCTAGKRDQAAALLERTQRHLIFVLLPPISFIFVAGSQFLSAWIGPDFSQHGSVPLRLLALAFLLNCVCSLDAIALDAVGRPDLTARQVAIAGATNIVVGAPLVYTFGVVGAAATLLVSMLVLAGGVWWAAVSQELIPDLPRRLRRTLARPIGLVAPITFALYLIAPSMKGLLSLVGTGAAYALVCYALLFFLTFESEDRATVEKLLVNMGMAWIPRVRPGV